MKKAFLIFSLFLLSLPLAAQERLSARFDLTSEPKGARVTLDGVTRGQTPLLLFDVAPGRHHLVFSLPGYVQKDVFLSAHEGERLTHQETLEEEKGLLLLKSDPPGAQIRIDGHAVGETPRFFGNLATKDAHTVVLTKAGYQDQKFVVRFSGREPLVREEKLVLDSGTLSCVSDPAGAVVTVNGVERGVTPLTVSGIPKGQALVKIRLAGHAEDVREVRLNAGETQTLSVALKALPGTLHLISNPPKATFYVNGALRGVSPLTVPDLPPGAYDVRCEKEGYGTLSKTLTLGNGASLRETFELASVMGRIEVRTHPGNAEILLDGKKVGESSSAGEGADDLSDVFAIEDVVEGEHQLLVRKAGYQDVSRTVRVGAKKTSRQHRVMMKRLFVPNVEIETFDGVVRGVFKSQNEQSIVIETKPGVEYPLPRAIIRKIEFLGE